MSRTLLLVQALAILLGVWILNARIGGTFSARCWAVFACVDQNSIYYVTVKYLPANHRLSENDLRWPTGLPGGMSVYLPPKETLVGFYLKEKVDGGKAIREENIVRQPDLRIQQGNSLFFYPLDDQARLAEFLDAESSVEVVFSTKDGNVVSHPLRVLALICKDKTLASCSAVLEVPNSMRDELALVQQKAQLHLLRTPGP